MGKVDYENLHIIYRKCVEFCKNHNLPFSFKIDSGDFETAIQFKEIDINVIHHTHPPSSKNWETNPEIKCPDLLDYHYKIIIEFEEEGCKKRPGAYLATKGHGYEGDISTVRDTERNRFYKLSKFRFLRFYETDLKEENWNKLYSFLLECHKEDKKNLMITQ